MSFDKVLVANRGEIARRILRTCHAMGLSTVAVHSEADRAAPFVAEADEAVCIGPAPAAESYLVMERLVEAAHRTGAGALHPGYGFLAENAELAEVCEGAGIVFVGPSAAAIRAMGSKIEAKARMTASGVPVVPGFDGGLQDDAGFLLAAAEIGYPILVKASAGGGGKGMRVVRSQAALVEALGAGRREAIAAFGDDRLLLERFVEEPRHIEVQILGDATGRVVHLFERECTVQRRHQKIIEETPSPALDPALRAAICAAAVRAGEAVGYRSAGTVEFILAPDGAFYFLEMNTRLQVEHPVTELVTGLDLVRLQLEIALGGSIPWSEGALVARGHALECRLYAEDPAQGFLPQTGRLEDWHFDRGLEGLRIDSGVEAGSEVGVYYDPMLAKVITWGETREASTRRMIRALSTASVQGVSTNRRFLVDVLRHPAWAAGDLSTAFIDTHFPVWRAPEPSPGQVIRAAIAATLAEVLERSASRAILPGLPRGFRNNPSRPPSVVWRRGDRTIAVSYRGRGGDRFDVEADGASLEVEVVSMALPAMTIAFDRHRQRLRVVRCPGGLVRVHVEGEDVALHRAPRFPEVDAEASRGGLRAPMTGKVQRILVAAGDEVSAGQPLVVLEAMKMEHTLEASTDGVVAEVLAVVGEVVDADVEIIRMEAP